MRQANIARWYIMFLVIGTFLQIQFLLIFERQYTYVKHIFKFRLRNSYDTGYIFFVTLKYVPKLDFF